MTVPATLSKRSAQGSRDPREVPRVKRQPFSNDGSVNLRAFFNDAILLWLLTTWLIKGGISEIRGGLLDLEHLWLTNQIAELH